jgi:hypothetical protein
MASIKARGRRLGPPPAQRSTAAVLATTRNQGVQDGRRLQGSAVRSSALQNEGRGMSRRAKGRQPRIVPEGGLGSQRSDRLPTDTTARVTVTEVRPIRGQLSGLSLVR